MSTIKLAIIKSFHFLMRNDFTSGRQKNRKALRCVSNWIVSQSIDCGIYYHYGNETLHILQQWKWEATLRSFTLYYHQESYNANLLLGVMTVTTIFIWRCVLLQMNSSKALPRKSATGSEKALPVVCRPPQGQMENLMALMNFLELLTATLSFRTVAA